MKVHDRVIPRATKYIHVSIESKRLGGRDCKDSLVARGSPRHRAHLDDASSTNYYYLFLFFFLPVDDRRRYAFLSWPFVSGYFCLFFFFYEKNQTVVAKSIVDQLIITKQ